MRASRLERWFEWLMDNVFDIVTIVFAVYLGIRHEVRPFGPNDIAQLTTSILVVLGLIAWSSLWQRNRKMKRIENVAQEGRDLMLRHFTRQVSASEYLLREQRLLKEMLATADTVLLAGVTLRRTVRDYLDALVQRLERGAHVQIIIVDPEEEKLLQMMCLRSTGAPTAEDWRIRLGSVESDIRTLVQAVRRSGKGTLEVGYLPYMPSFGFHIVDPEEPHGLCYVELYHHKTSASNPTFELRATRDGAWYRHFLGQYESLWDSCRQKVYPDSAKIESDLPKPQVR